MPGHRHTSPNDTRRLSSLWSSGSRVTVHGFTLIELVTSIVIIGVLGAIVAPRFFDTSAFNERGYVDEVAFTLRYAQKIAIASECDTSVTINAAGYVVMQQAACNAGAWTTPVRRTDGSVLTGTAPTGVALAPNATIVFDKAGGTAVAPPVLGTGIFTLSVDATSGLVTVLP
jgi:MSHA pilin protein MshC